MLNVLYSLVKKSNINKQVRKTLLINQRIWYMDNACYALGVVAVNEVYCVMHLSLSLSLSLPLSHSLRPTMLVMSQTQ